MFDLLQAAYADVAGVAGVSGMPGHLTRFGIALAALLIPTFLMGGTLPLLVRGFVRNLPELGKATSRLYGVNTLGAMTGTLAAGYLLIPSYGIAVAIFTGVALNLGIAIVVLALLKLQPAQAQHELPAGKAVRASTESSDPAGLSAAWRTNSRFAVLVGFGLAGFASLLTQMAWIRALILVVGGSVYAFTITLTSFLAGIGLGSLAYNRFLSSPRSMSGDALLSRRMLQAALLAMMTGITILLGLPLIGKLPVWFLQGYSADLHANFAVFQAFIFVLCFSFMILPTLFMGALFPLITVMWTRSLGQTGRGVGMAYAINATGTIFFSAAGWAVSITVARCSFRHSADRRHLCVGCRFILVDGFPCVKAG